MGVPRRISTVLDAQMSARTLDAFKNFTPRAKAPRLSRVGRAFEDCNEREGSEISDCIKSSGENFEGSCKNIENSGEIFMDVKSSSRDILGHR